MWLTLTAVGSKTDEEMASIFEPENLNLRFFGREDSLGRDLDKLMLQPQGKLFRSVYI